MAQITIGAEAIIGEASLIHPGVRIGERVRIGEKCIIHHNASIDRMDLVLSRRNREVLKRLKVYHPKDRLMHRTLKSRG